VEISKPDLEALTVKPPFEARNNITAYTLANGHQLNLLGEGRLVNLACGDGHPAEVMDLSFAMQFLAMRHMLQNKGRLENKLYLLPDELDQEVASIKLKAMGFGVDTLSEEQWKYLHEA
jgi:adenosylhomocysteinase